MALIRPDEIKMQVREHYAARVTAGSGCCAEGDASCCATPPAETVEGFDGPSLGCGTPLQYAKVQTGETVVDLGSGAGRETLLAARQAGPSGRAVGIDMTPEMIDKARDNARRTGAGNAEFRLGEIERLPLNEGEVDVVISNCVINLVPDKPAAFREAFRVLRPGGRMVVSDIVSSGPLPQAIRESAAAWAGCVAGALDVEEYLEAIRRAGFTGVEMIEPAGRSALPLFSATIRAAKPA
jgi:SAM-dependent methyltransferase